MYRIPLLVLPNRVHAPRQQRMIMATQEMRKIGERETQGEQMNDEMFPT